MSERTAPRKGLILAVNAGSSSLKISLYRLASAADTSSGSKEPVELLLVSNITDVSSPPASFSFSLAAHNSGREAKKEHIDSINDHTSAFSHFLDYLKREASIDSSQIAHVCHRVVHGGDCFEPLVINNESYEYIERLTDLAPLHNGAALSVMKACIDALPGVQSIAYFDTSFHRSIPNHVASYAIDQSVAGERGLKKYGFHGLSYGYILRAVSHFLHKDSSALNLIVMHLGSGASVCAIKQGISIDTSMGLTPVSGLPGATRSGVVDPSLIFHYTNRAGRMSHDRNQAVDVHVTLAEEILNKKSGWKSLTGTTDFGEITARMKENEEKVARGTASEDEAKWKLAFDLFVDRIVDFVGAYYLKLGGQVDALVFAGGIGEKGAELREAVVEKMECIGFGLDAQKNTAANKEDEVVVDIGTQSQDRKVLVCKTDEQVEMARQCALAKKFWTED